MDGKASLPGVRIDVRVSPLIVNSTFARADGCSLNHIICNRAVAMEWSLGKSVCFFCSLAAS